MNETNTAEMSQKKQLNTIKLFHSLAELTLTTSYDSVKIQQISQKSHIHRATFYRYFESKQDLMERGSEIFWDRLMKELEEYRLSRIDESDPGSPIPAYINYFFKLIFRNGLIFRAFLQKGGSLFFRQISMERMVKFISDFRLTGRIEEESEKAVANMIASSLLSVLESLIFEEYNQKTIDNYYRFVSAGVSAFLR